MDANVQESQLTRCARVHKHPHMELSLLLITKRQKVLDRIFVAVQVSTSQDKGVQNVAFMLCACSCALCFRPLLRPYAARRTINEN